MRLRIGIIISAIVLTLLLVPAIAGAAVTKQTADVMNQAAGGGGLYAADAARLSRTDSGLQIQVSMPAPDPGSYVYPDGAIEGAPQVFTGWAFVFNYPALCSGPCDMNDLGDHTPAKGGVYNFAGHIVGGPNLTLAGHILVGQETAPSPFPGVVFAPLESPMTAEVHVATAPHGEVDPAQLPGQIMTPIGGPPHWFVALFLP